MDSATASPQNFGDLRTMGRNTWLGGMVFASLCFGVLVYLWA